MAAAKVLNNSKFWQNGVPFIGLRNKNNPNAQKFWQNGAPVNFLLISNARKSAFFFVD